MTSIQSAHTLQTVSTISAGIFLLILPVRIWKLYKSRIRNTHSWQGPFKAVGAWDMALDHAVLTLDESLELGDSAQDRTLDFTIYFYSCYPWPKSTSTSGESSTS
ncbi:hypothetical protein SBOR_2827 [Sclerotinia borealis F-4128]|uniref:Uncharacterized protein n=1 Tax=Sclerotinia borealis (strain F-4128) TaxID=1432307 RepID=W9CLY9_SCLBF|nr:hypothetical protein SBOR_2827 [Sclerotinia borealis F-4128]